ncbi:MAG: hypothetical protein R3B40_30505 [Polyangiales bacterium]
MTLSPCPLRTPSDASAPPVRRPARRRPRGQVLIGVLGLLAAVGATVGLAQTGPRTIGVDEIHPGMRGYGLSVLSGTEPERFDVEVIDVLHNFRPDQDLILVRTPHPLLNRARAVGGMSGSPVYLDGRLAGAYAYGWPYGTDPVIGVTPIASMLAELNRPVRASSFPGAEVFPTAPGAGRATSRRPRAGGGRAAALPPTDADALTGIRGDIARVAQARVNGPVGLQPAQTPMMLGGFTDDVAQLLSRQLSALGLDPVQAGGSGAAAPQPNARYVDGGSIGVQLVRGDMNTTGIGTVTHVGGQRVVAFGHPMLNGGETGLPTTTARVLHVLVSEARSFKIAEAITPLGTLVHDRQSAIVIDTRFQAATIPLRVRLHGVEGAPRTEWNMELAHHRSFSPMLAYASVLNALKAAAADSTDVVYRARTRLRLEGRDALEFEERGYMDDGPAEAGTLAQLRVFAAMLAAFDNPFGPARVLGVEIDLEVDYRRDVLQLVSATTLEEEVEAGSTVPVYLRLRRWGQPDTTRVVQVRVPRHAAGESLQLTIAPGPSQTREHGRPRDLDEYLRDLGDRYAATSLVAAIALPTRGLRFDGHAVSALPGSALDALHPTNGTLVSAPFETRERQELPMGDVVFGSARLTLRVRPARANP